ncbi:MAG TPA: alkaline phosphatase family protein [Gaiellaceae bacterium]|jgi:phospholipase C|nr:alkaline phosphatase family protein [Gaiellaceae bacterium]
MLRKRAFVGLLAITAIAAGVVLIAGIAGAAPGPPAPPHPPGPPGHPARTATPIKHVVVIFQENVSFDHYFGTYPDATGGDGQPFAARPGTQAVDGLTPSTDPSIPASLRHATNLLVPSVNPNSSPPLRLDSSAIGLPNSPGGQITCDQDHNYSDEQQAEDGGKMDKFPESVGTDGGTKTPFGTPCLSPIVMDYYDGNTVTGLWNYAQHFSMSDNSFGSTFGPSAPGAINVASGDTGNVDLAHVANKGSAFPVFESTSSAPNGDVTPDGQSGDSLTSDAQPYWDDCSTRDAVALNGTNIGDELNSAGLSWGWFQGGFRPTTAFATASAAVSPGQSTATFTPDEFSGAFSGKVVPAHASNQALCDAVHPVGVALGATDAQAAPLALGFKDDYIAHHEPFQYYSSTANPHHLTIATDNRGNDALHGSDSLSDVGMDTQTFKGTYGVNPQFNTPNHNYDTSDFDQLMAAIDSGKLPADALPAVTYLKAPGYQDGHAAYSDPADEQAFVVKEVNSLMASPDWSSTAIFVNYDDSDGWYDHVYAGVQNPSHEGADNLTNTKTGPISITNPTSGQCGASPQPSGTPLAGEQGRCGFGPRLPMMLISPCAAADHVDHDLSDQASILNFVEYNWNLRGIPGSFDQALKSTDQSEGIPFDLAGMFDFSNCDQAALPLDPSSGQIDLSGAHLTGDLQGSDYANGNLSNANLDNSHLEGAFLPGANLTGASLHGVDAEGADLVGANLTNANLDHADLTGAAVSGITWSNTRCPDGSSSSTHGGTCVGHLADGPPGPPGHPGH